MKSEGGSEAADFEKMRLKQKVEDLQKMMVTADSRCEGLKKENDFYHKITTLFLTIRKVIDKEKKFCY